MIKNIIIIGLLAWVIYLTGVSNFFNGIRTTVDQVEELVDNKHNMFDNINGFDNESEEE